MVSFADKCGTRFLDGIIDKGTSITKLWSHVNLIPIENHIKTKCYALDSRKFSFDIYLMLRLVVVKSFRNFSFSVISGNNFASYFRLHSLINPLHEIPKNNVITFAVKSLFRCFKYIDIQTKVWPDGVLKTIH